MAVRKKGKNSENGEAPTPEQTMQEKRNEAKETLRGLIVRAYIFSKENPGLIANANVEFQLGSILNKFFGGINQTRQLTSATNESIKASQSRVIVHNISEAKKKPLKKQVQDAQHADKTTSELKLAAQKLGLETKGKDREEIISMIEWQEAGNMSVATKKKAIDMKAALKSRGIDVAPEKPKRGRKKKEIIENDAAPDDLPAKYVGLGASTEEE